jgi:ArsR family transcriptional regulator, arsenate/arsenite/antimonite-responsive transcriptional repressor
MQFLLKTRAKYYNICSMAHIKIEDIAEVQRALSDPMRILIMRLLFERELCVCEIMHSLEEPQYKVSRHLAVLKKAGLVRGWREGTWMHYEIAPGLAPEWREALEGLRRVWDTNREVQSALWRLQQRATRPAGAAATACCTGQC